MRTPVGKAPNGALRTTRPDDLAALVLGEALRRAPAVDADGRRRRRARLRDAGGRARVERRAHREPARGAAGVGVGGDGQSLLRVRPRGDRAAAPTRIALGGADVVLAGGTESMSLVPMGGHKIAPNPHLVAQLPGRVSHDGPRRREPRARERDLARGAGRVRARQPPARDRGDRRRPVRRRDRAGRRSTSIAPDAKGAPVDDARDVRHDEGPRRDTSAEALAKLKPAFHAAGSVTAGNSSQTSDGAAAVVRHVRRPRARALGLTPLARLVGYATAGVEPGALRPRAGAGDPQAARTHGPLARRRSISSSSTRRSPRRCSRACASCRSIRDRLNVNGGAIALGHPLGCTGARADDDALHEMARRQARYGLVTMCVGGGMGAAAMFERLSASQRPKCDL